MHGTEQAHGEAVTHGKGSAHGSPGRTALALHTAKTRTHDNDSRTAKSSCRTAANACTAMVCTHGKEPNALQSCCRASLTTLTAKNSLPSKSLPGDRCRATSHSKTFAVHIGPFAVRIVARQRAIFL
jgi:hypothetical protein